MCIRGPKIIHMRQELPTSKGDFRWMYGVVWLVNRLIGPFVFENNLTENTYEAFLRNALPGLLEDSPLMVRSQMYFQHDGASPHYTRHVRDYLNESFPNETIQTALLLPFSPCWYVLKTAWQLEEDTLNSSCKARPRVLPSTLNRETAATPNTS